MIDINANGVILFPAIHLVFGKTDVCCMEVRRFAFLLLCYIVVKCLDSNAAQDSDCRDVAYYHESLEHISGIPYKTCA